MSEVWCIQEPMLGYIPPGSMATMGAGVGIQGGLPPPIPPLLAPTRRLLEEPTYGRTMGDWA